MTEMKTNILPIAGPLLCNIEETQRLIPVSRTTLWELGREKKLEMVHIGRRRFFTYESICIFVESLTGGASHD